MTSPLTHSELEAYLDEALTPELTAQVETALRQDKKLAKRLAEILQRRDSGVHSLGEIWRRHQLSCLTRDQLGSYLLGALEPHHAEYVRFHVEQIGCRICQANLEDLREKAKDSNPSVDSRRRNYFQSSVGYLRNEE
ncbi:MAG: hypothetical protein KDA60_00415 [Planctomycetales bacterium]|nr:hypothetical protein [Planctomycetales bacterium]